MKTSKDIKELVTTTASDRSKATNATAVDLIISSNSNKRKRAIPYTAIAKTLLCEFQDDDLNPSPKFVTKLKAIYSEYQKLVKNPDRSWKEIESFLNTEIILNSPLSDIRTSVLSPCNVAIRGDIGIGRESQTGPLVPPRTPTKSQCNNVMTSVLIPCNVTANGDIEVGKESETGRLVHLSTPTRSHCNNVSCIASKNTNANLHQQLRVYKKKNFLLRKSIAQIKKSYEVKLIKQTERRNTEKVQKLKSVINSQKMKLRKLHRNVASNEWKMNSILSEKKCMEKENRQLKKEMARQKEIIKEKDQFLKQNTKTIKQAEKCIEHLEVTTLQEDDGFEEQHLKSKSGKMYAPEIRTCIYKELICDVPIQNCGYLLNEVVKVFLSKELSSIPSPATSAQMAYELGVLSSVQITEFLLSKKPLCLSWDATTIDGSHINEVHLTVDKVMCMILDVQHLPGGTAADYVTHIIGALSETCSVYAKYSEKNPQEILSIIKSNISCTLTDRAAVNGCVTRQLCSELDSELLLLNCNVHPLDSVARYARTNLAELDEAENIRGSCLGSDGTATNLIRAMSVLRFKDGTGDPLGFKSFLRESNLPLGTFVRYVGNRLHVLFHLAGLLILHKDQLEEFIDRKCTAAGLIRARILKDLRNAKVVVQVWALGIIGKVFSGPWMSLTYSSQMSNLEMAPQVKSCLDKINEWIKNPEELLAPTTDVFNKEISADTDIVLSALVTFCTDEKAIQINALNKLLSAIHKVLTQQLAPFISGEFAQPSESQLSSTQCAPTNNMTSERALGLLDNLWRKAPNATLGFLNGKIKCKLNKTLTWLEEKNTEEKNALIKFAVSEARAERTQSCIKRRALYSEIESRRTAIAVQRENKQKKAISKKICSAILTADYSDIQDMVRKDKIIEFCQDNSSVVGRLAIHTIDRKDYYLRVLDVMYKKKKKPSVDLTISYWLADEMEANSVDHTILAGDFYADIELGNIVFV